MQRNVSRIKEFKMRSVWEIYAIKAVDVDTQVPFVHLVISRLQRPVEASDVIYEEDRHERDQPRAEGACSPERLSVSKDGFYYIDKLSPRGEDTKSHEVLKRIP